MFKLLCVHGKSVTVPVDVVVVVVVVVVVTFISPDEETRGPIIMNVPS